MTAPTATGRRPARTKWSATAMHSMMVAVANSAKVTLPMP